MPIIYSNMAIIVMKNDFTNANHLIEGYRRTQKASGWKDSTQNYGINCLRRTCDLQKTIRQGVYQQEEGSTFRRMENGHLRLVKALTVRDMVMQHALCDYVMIPALRPYLIHDNGASLKGKGISFTRKRLMQHLSWHYRRYGREGYVLKIDFRKYFDNIDHAIFFREVEKHIEGYPYAKEMLRRILEANEVDVSYTDDPDIKAKVFNALEYGKLPRELFTGARYMAKSMGIGAPVSQIAGVYLPSRIDHYCKTVRGIHCYDAYMDDRIIIHPSKTFLQELLKEIKGIAAELGIHVNDRKTQIVKLSRGFTFLKTRYTITKTGKIIRRIPHDVVTRQRRKMKALARYAVAGEFTLEAFDQQYKSWYWDKNRYHARRTLRNVRHLYRRLRKWITKTKTSTSKS